MVIIDFSVKTLALMPLRLRRCCLLLACLPGLALADPEIAERFNGMGTPPMRGWTPDRFSRYVAEEVTTWAPLVRASGARVE